MNMKWNCTPEGRCLVKHNCRNSETESCVEASAVVAWCLGGTEDSGSICVQASQVQPTGACELTELRGDYGVGTVPEGAVPFDSCVRVKGRTVGVEQAPDCNCSRQCSAESQGIPV